MVKDTFKEGKGLCIIHDCVHVCGWNILDSSMIKFEATKSPSDLLNIIETG